MMTCESFANALVEGQPLSEVELVHARECAACARLAAGVAVVPSLRVNAPPPPDARSLNRAVRSARLRESGLLAVAAALLLGLAIGGFEARPPAAEPLRAEADPGAADAALLALVEGLDGLSEPAPDLTDRDFLDVLDPFASEPIVTFGEL